MPSRIRAQFSIGAGVTRNAAATSTLLAEHVTRHGLATWRPIALFYRAALAYAQGDASSGTIDGLKRAIEEFRNVNYLARMPYYLSVLADALAKRGRLGEAETTIRTALDIARAQNEVGAFQSFCASRRPF